MSAELNPAFPIVGDNGVMADAFRVWTQGVNLGTPIVNSGSPEGVVAARQFQLCINSAGTTGTLLYVKMLPEISGDRKRGWVAV
jgi:hypothetical protein